MGVLGFGGTPSEKYQKSSHSLPKIKYDGGNIHLGLNIGEFLARDDNFGKDVDKLYVTFYDFKYKLNILKKNKLIVNFFGGVWKKFDVSVTDDLIIDQISLDEINGQLTITSKSKIIFDIQLTHKGQAHKFGAFLDFVKLRDVKL